jgi:chromosome partitioning protein
VHRHGRSSQPHRGARDQPGERRAVHGQRPGRAEGSSRDIVVTTTTPGIDVAPATLDLASTEVDLLSAIGREYALPKPSTSGPGTLRLHSDRLPADAGPLTINGLVAANGVIIPVQTQYYALKGLAALVKVINTIRSKLNKDLRVLGLLPTFYDPRTVLAREMLDEMRENGDNHVFETSFETP